MRPSRRHHRLRTDRRGVSQIIAAILLVGLTITAGVILWTFHFQTPPATPTVGFVVRSGGSNPVWGDPTDQNPNTGAYSILNTSEIIISSTSPLNIPLSEVTLTFLCNGLYGQATSSQGAQGLGNNTTVLITGSLASMTWYPGFGTYPSSGPQLGWCANFHAGGFGGGAFGTFFNRLGLFDPLTQNAVVLEAGDTFILYIHNGGYPLDYEDCGGTASHPVFDCDDYHGAPPWCFTDPGACTIVLTYTGTPGTVLATIPVVALAPPPASQG